MSEKDILTTIVLVIIIFLIYYMSYYERKKDEIEEDRIILKTYPDNVKMSVEKWAVAGLDDRNIE